MKRFDPWSFGKVYAVLGLIWGIIFGVIMAAVVAMTSYIPGANPASMGLGF